MKTYAEQITAYEAKRAALAAGMEAINSKAAEAGRTLDASEKEEFDGFVCDIEEVDEHIKRLRVLETATAAKAAPVSGGSAAAGTASRAGAQVSIAAQPKLAPGMEFARAVKCFGMAKGSIGEAIGYAKARYGENANVVGVLTAAQQRGDFGVERAAVEAGATVSGNWAENLVGNETAAFADFVEFLRPQTILGKFGQNGIPALRSVPFRTALVSQTGGGEGYWVGEGKAKPLTSLDFARTTLEPLKVANICVLTDEIIRSSSPAAEGIVRDELVAALRSRLDIDFINPNKTASSGVSPASITNGADSVAASGTGDADDVRLDARSLMYKFVQANNAPTTGVWIMSAGMALSLSMMVNALGQPEFSGIGMDGGRFMGLPVITSEHVGNNVVLLNASDIYLGDEGGFRIDMSREASLEMLDGSLAGDSGGGTPAAAGMVSLWQTNSVGFLAERTINWSRRRPSGVTYLTGAAWGGAVNT